MESVLFSSGPRQDALREKAEVIDLETWPRRTHYAFFASMAQPFYALTFPVDVTRLRELCKARALPSFTDLKPGSTLFHIVTLEAGEDLGDFCRRARAQSESQTEFLTAGPWEPDQEVYFTCLPWFPLTALTNERDGNPSDTIPRVSWGRWEEADGRTVLHLSLELNHRLLDGVHVGQFYTALNEFLTAL